MKYVDFKASFFTSSIRDKFRMKMFLLIVWIISLVIG